MNGNVSSINSSKNVPLGHISKTLYIRWVLNGRDQTENSTDW